MKSGFYVLAPFLCHVLFFPLIVRSADDQNSLVRLEHGLKALSAVESAIYLDPESLSHQLGSVEAVQKYVEELIHYDSYVGRLRGPEGTLQAEAGNDVDQSELLATMLRHLGNECRYAVGRRKTIEGNWVEHLWIQLREGDSWRDLDPSFPELSIGDPDRRLSTTRHDIPANLVHRVRLETKYRIRISDKVETRTALVRELVVADLYGTPVTLANRFQGRRSEEIFLVEAVQPVLQIGGELIPGDVITKSKTDHPPSPGSRMLGIFDRLQDSEPPKAEQNVSPGLELLSQWVEVQIISPKIPRDRFTYTIFDAEIEEDRLASNVYGLLGAAAFGFSPAPVTETHLQRQALADSSDLLGFVESLEKASAEGSFSRDDPGDSISSEEAVRINLSFEKAQRIAAWAVLQSYFVESDKALLEASSKAGSRAYYAAPRAILASVSLRNKKTRCDLDLRRNNVVWETPEEESQELVKFLTYHRGLYESRLEGAVLKQFTGISGVTAGDVLSAAQSQQIPLRLLFRDTRQDLRSCTLDRQSKTLINRALGKGLSVLLPESAPMMDGVSRFAWYEYDPETGLLDGVFSTGKHQGMTEYINEEVVIQTLVSQGMSYFSSTVAGYYFSLATGLGHFYACLLDLDDPGKPCFGQPDVCLPAKADAVVFCKAWKEAKKYWDMAGAAQGLDIAGLIPWPDAWETLAGDPCERGASYGLQWFGCGGS